ncbi:MAG: PPC domain-containing protein [Candidatus Thiodiazotropha sp.]
MIKLIIFLFSGFIYQAAYAAAPQDFSDTFNNHISSQDKSWATHTFEMVAPGSIELSLDWNQASADLNLFLYNQNDELVQYVNTTAVKPKQIQFAAQSPGQYKIGIKCKRGDANYRVNLNVDFDNKLVLDYPGQPQLGTLYWGAAISGNGEPAERHELPSGNILSIRRTFFQWSQRTGYMIRTASADLLAGRLPWISVKTPSWKKMANGLHDNEIDEMLKALDNLPGPVWLTIHHEPEGGAGHNYPDDPGGPSMHLAMNKRVRMRMNALGVDNVALAPILMSYTWNMKSGRNPDEWWEPGVYDFLGVDHYQKSEASMLTPVWLNIRQWAAAHGVDIAVGEWGMRGTNKAAGLRVKEWYDHAVNSYKDGLGGRVTALCAFDSALNSPSGSWELKGAQLTIFHDLMNDSRTANVELDSGN